MNIRFILRHLTLLLLPVLALMVSCNEPDPDSISVVDNVTGEPVAMIEATPQSNIYTVKVLSTGNWTVTSSDDSWCYPNNNGTGGVGSTVLEIVVDEISGVSRTANLIFKSGMAEYIMVVNQTSFDEWIEVLPVAATVDYRAQKFAFVVNSNAKWTVDANPAAWVSATKIGDIVELDILENQTDDVDRTVSIEVQAEDSEASATFELTQTARLEATIDVNPSEYTFEMGADDVEISITTTLHNPSFKVSSTEDWCIPSAVANVSANTYVMTISVDANTEPADRFSIVNIVAVSEDGTSSLDKEVGITQRGVGAPELMLGLSEVVLDQPAKAGNSVSFVAKGTLTAASDAGWITNIVATVDGVTFDVTENQGEALRSAEIVVVASVGEQFVKKAITVYQNGIGALDLALSASEIEFAATANSFTVFATTNSMASDLEIMWMTPSASWCTFDGTPTALADGKSSANFDIVANSGLYARDCAIVVKLTAGEKSVVKSVVIRQAKGL